MKIGIDARPLCAPLTGIGIYTASLLERLLDTGHEWFLYADRPLVEGPWSDHPRARQRYGQASPQSLISLKIANWEYLRWSRLDEIQLFWSPRHHLPFLMSTSLPSVVTIHDLVWRRYPEVMPWRNRLLEKLAMARSLARADRVIAVSDFTASEIDHFYPAVSERCSVIPEAGRRFSGTGAAVAEAPYFLFVGTCEPRKNLASLLQALSRLPDIPHRLVMAGAPGWGGIDIAALASELDIGDRVELLGYVDDEALGALYGNATALVMPSLYEGFGLPVVEAMSFGTPVIVSNRGSLPEVAGHAGLVVEAESPDELARAMAEVATDAARRAELSRRSRQRAADFSWDRAASQTLAVLESAAG